jgi:hypothetical protein
MHALTYFRILMRICRDKNEYVLSPAMGHVVLAHGPTLFHIALDHGPALCRMALDFLTE